MTYAGVSAGASSVLTQISSQTVATTLASFTFSSIPGTYKALLLNISGLLNSGTVSEEIRIRMNGVTSNSYTFLYNKMPITNGNSPSVSSGATVNYVPIGHFPGASSFYMGALRAYFPNYTQTGAWKQAASQSDWIGSGSSNWYQTIFAGSWQDTTAALSTLLVYPANGSFSNPTTATLYGMS